MCADEARAVLATFELTICVLLQVGQVFRRQFRLRFALHVESPKVGFGKAVHTGTLKGALSVMITVGLKQLVALAMMKSATRKAKEGFARRAVGRTRPKSDVGW